MFKTPGIRCILPSNEAAAEGGIRCKGFECCCLILLLFLLRLRLFLLLLFQREAMPHADSNLFFREVLHGSGVLLNGPHPPLRALGNSSPEGCFHPDANYVFGLFPFS